MSPTWTTVLTAGSALTASMNAGVASVSEVSVGVVPYGASPYAASVSAIGAPPAPGRLQRIWTVPVAGQPATGSPSETVTVTDVSPGAPQVNVGLAVPPLANDPDGAVH